MSYVTMGLPPEVLAACLRFLAFRDLIAASHVSRFWRSSALTFPDLWSRISIDTLHWASPCLLHTAMARAGGHAVDLEFIPPGPVTEGMADAIAQHIDRFRSLKWTYSLQPVDITRPAPLLRELSCEEVRFHVPRNFLGGSPGALRTLLFGEAIFPSVCPALSTVTHLHATFPEYYEEDTGFRHLFALCPRLETLHLHELADRAAIGLPTCSAPRTLRDVVLQSFGDCDLLELYATWALHSVRNVQLCMPMAVNVGVHAPSFFGDALTLSVTLSGSSDSEAHIVAQLPGARTRMLICSELTDVRHPRSRLAHMLYAPNLRTLTVPLAVLVHAVRRLRWPDLAHLTVHIHESSGTAQGRPRFRIAALECLRAVGATLEMLELYFYGSSSTDPPLVACLDDAQVLKESLVSLRDCLPSEVHVHGFPPEVAREIDIDRPRVVLH